MTPPASQKVGKVGKGNGEIEKKKKKRGKEGGKVSANFRPGL